MDALHGDDESALLAAADASLTDDADRRSAATGEVKVVDGALTSRWPWPSTWFCRFHRRESSCPRDAISWRT